MSAKTILILSASLLLSVAIAAPNAALAQFGPPPGPPPMLAGPPPGPVAGLPPGLAGGPPRSVVVRPVLLLAFRPVAPRAHLRVRSWVVRLVSMVLADCVVLSVAARPIFVASRVEPRPTAPTATPAIVTAMATVMATGTGLMRRLQLTPMAAPTPPPTTAATTCLHTGDTAPDAFGCVMETD
jgi:hypothetical protein